MTFFHIGYRNSAGVKYDYAYVLVNSGGQSLCQTLPKVSKLHAGRFSSVVHGQYLPKSAIKFFFIYTFILFGIPSI